MAFLNRAARAVAGILLVAGTLPVAGAWAATDIQGSVEYRVKAAMLYNFTRFVRWPATMATGNELVLCVLGENPFGDALQDLAGRPTGDRTLAVRHLAGDDGTDGCGVLFIAASEQANVGNLLRQLGHRPVLTVSELEGFIEEGGIIRFILEDNKVRFRINMTAAEQAGLGISSKLLKLARDVDGAPRQGP